MNGKVTIYTLAHPITGEIRYIGKADDIVVRLAAHLREKNFSKKSNWVQSLRKIGLRPKIESLEEVYEHEWQEAERYWIESFRQLGFRLTNVDSGGRGGFPRSAEVKAKISAKHKGKKLSPEHRLKISIARKNMDEQSKRNMARFGKKLAEETKAKLSKFFKGRKMPTEAVKRIMAKKRTLEARLLQSKKIKAVWALRKLNKNVLN